VLYNPAEYIVLEESFSPVALEMMGNWLKENVNDEEMKSEISGIIFNSLI
jgi:hypothetical protein